MKRLTCEDYCAISFGAVGIALLWHSAGGLAALGVFFCLWGNNLSQGGK